MYTENSKLIAARVELAEFNPLTTDDTNYIFLVVKALLELSVQ